MKRTLTILFAAVASAALAQTPTVVEKPAVKASQVKVVAKTPAPAAKPSPTAIKVVPVAAQKPVAVVAKPAAAPATVKVVAVPAAHANASAPVKPVAVSVPAKAVVVAAPAAHAAQVSVKPAATPAAHVAVVSAKPVAPGSASKITATPVKADPFKAAVKAPAKVSSKPVAVATKSASTAPTTVAVQDSKAATKPAKSINTAGRRDPFISPVVNMSAMGSGCSSGKRCLAIDQVALKGVVKSDGGMIAVVVNAMDKAYFLRENDPVFNGYVLKITGDSVVFKETFHDKLGKPLTRDVTKTISRPVA
jgi:Tfp pilus assembly protein PilP